MKKIITAIAEDFSFRSFAIEVLTLFLIASIFSAFTSVVALAFCMIRDVIMALFTNIPVPTGAATMHLFCMIYLISLAVCFIICGFSELKHYVQDIRYMEEDYEEYDE